MRFWLSVTIAKYPNDVIASPQISANSGIWGGKGTMRGKLSMTGNTRFGVSPASRPFRLANWKPAFTRIKNLRWRNFATHKDAGSDNQSPLDFVKSLANEEGVRFAMADENDEEDWEDIVEELGDPSSLVLMQDMGLINEDERAAGASDVTDPEMPMARDIKEIDSEEVESLSQHGNEVEILDVRNSMEFHASHMEASRNVPINTLTREIANEWPHKHVVVIGTGDHRSLQACIRLTKLYGLSNVYHYVESSED